MRAIYRLWCVALITASSLGAGRIALAQAINDWTSKFAIARGLLVEGNAAGAEAIYLAALNGLQPADSTLLATALFGRAAALQLRISAGDSTRGIIDTAIAGYKRAESLNAALQRGAEYNLGLLARVRDDHRQALSSFAAALRSTPTNQRSAVEIEMAREYEELNQASSAVRYYSSALEADSLSDEALRGYFRALVAGQPVDDVMKAVERWGTDSSRALSIAASLPDLFTRAFQPPNEQQAHAVLRNIATLLTRGRAGPPWFELNLAAPLRRAVDRFPALLGATDLLDAYHPQRPARVADLGASPWWMRTDQDRAAWSSLLRWLGDWYYSQDKVAEARNYYEVAISNWKRDPGDAAIDRKAVLPLTIIYSQTGDQARSVEIQQHIDMIFNAKAIAYENNRLESIRDFHTALGAYYAAKGQWTGDGPQNAEYQLQHMRDATRQLANQGKKVDDPPELLASLAQHYQQTADPQKADAVKRDLRDVYRRRGNPDRADSLIKRIDQQTPIIRQARVTETKTVSPPAAVDRSTSIVPLGRGANRAAELVVKQIVIRLIDSATKAPVDGNAVATIDSRDTTVRVERGILKFTPSAPTKTLHAVVTVAGYWASRSLALQPGDSIDVRVQRKVLAKPFPRADPARRPR